MAEQKSINALGREAAYQLANVTKTAPQFAAITPRWVSRFLDYKGLESGIYRVNKVVEGETPLDVLCSQDPSRVEIPQGLY
ncbi:major membrane protein I [Klebsiella variicola]|uniref:Major membrane protein I n=1 Tax=Klebsiella variicola TaxID=244366 RepID=A0A7H4MNB0_KLEVA|nr:major membrane protein I [Klebsiella variicola]